MTCTCGMDPATRPRCICHEPPQPAPARTHVRYAPLPAFPAVKRDLSLVLPAGVTVGAVEAVMREVFAEVCQTRGITVEMGVFDVYPLKAR